ncbi:MAG: alpha/beta fold hydrolase [Acidobacteriota bacterium]
MEHHITINGGDTAYWEYNAGLQPTLIMVHGFRGTHHGLLKIAEALPEYRLIIPDLPGFGDSEALPAGHTIADYIAWLHEFRKHVDTERQSYIVGHSFGTIITSHYAAAHAANVKKLVLINPIGSPALESEQRFLVQLAILYYWLGRKLPASAARAWISMKPATKIMSITMRKTKDKGIRRYIDEQHYAHFSSFANPTQLAQAFRTSVSHDVYQVAHELHIPTLLIAGEKDDITSLAKQRHLHGAIDGAQLVVIDGVGHLTHYETPEAVATAIRNFIQ